MQTVFTTCNYVVLNLRDTTNDLRFLSNLGLQVNLKSSVLSINFLDKNGCLYPTPFEFWKDSDDSSICLHFPFLIYQLHIDESCF